MYNMGLLYAKGQGVEVDFVQARQWWDKAAAAGNADAMRDLGSLYREGKGVRKDEARAQQLFQQAAAAESKH